MSHPEIDQYYFDCAQAIIRGEDTSKIPRPASMSNLVVSDEVIVKKVRKPITFELIKENNPNNEPTGHGTGRCMKCGSTDLVDDNLSYGCNCCGAFYHIPVP